MVEILSVTFLYIHTMKLINMFVIIYGKETGRCLHDDASSFTGTLIRDLSPGSVWFWALIMLNMAISMQCGDDAGVMTDPIWS